VRSRHVALRVHRVLILLYFLLCLVCSGLQEAVASLRHQRAEFLHAAIGRLLGPLSEQLYRHPLIEAISPSLGTPRLPLRVRRVPPPPNPAEAPPPPRVVKPSYIPSRTFALALLSILGGDREAAAAPGRRQDLLDGAAAALGDREGDGDEVRRLKTSLRLLLAEADRDLDGWLRGVARWFDDAMDRYSGWYKRRTQLALLLYGLVVGIVLNADTFLFANALWNDSVLRASVVAEAQRVAQTAPAACPPAAEDGGASADPLACVAERVGSLKALRVPMGWPDWPWRWAAAYRVGEDPRFPHSPGGVALKLAGLALTAVAVAQGSQFWFQLLNRFVNLRLTGQPPPKQGD
jgi:hypothetical protein